MYKIFLLHLRNHPTITSLTLGNSDCYKFKNKLGVKGYASLIDLVSGENSLISMVDITDLTIQSIILPELMNSFTKNAHLVHLDMSMNDLSAGINLLCHVFDSPNEL